MMTRTEQRRMVTQYGMSQLTGTTIQVLNALIAANNLRGRSDDAEKAFRVGLSKLEKRTGRDHKTIQYHIGKLEDKGLVTVVPGKPGTTNHYVLSLGEMEKWDTSDQTQTIKRQMQSVKKLDWKHRDRKWKAAIAETVFSDDGICVLAAVAGETNRERRLRLEMSTTVTVI